MINKIKQLKVRAMVAIMTGYFKPAIKHLTKIIQLKESNEKHI